MSTQINIEANGFVALKQQADKVAQLNQQTAVKRQETEKLTKAERLQRTRENFNELANRFRTNRTERVAKSNGANVKSQQPANRTASTTQSKDSKGADRNDVPSNKLIRELSAQRGGVIWGILSYDWVAITKVGDTGIPKPGGGTFTYRYIEAKDLRLLLSTAKTPVSTPAQEAAVLPQDSYAVTFATVGILGNSSNHNNLSILDRAGEFANSTYTGTTYYTQAPVVSSAGGNLYGVLRHSYSRVDPFWESFKDGYSPYSANGTTFYYTYVYFKFNAKSGALDLRSSTVTYNNRPDVSVADLTPYLEGGSIWAEQYEANAFPGDPSVELRKLGYYGDYNIRGNRAYMLRYNGSPLSSYNSRNLQGKSDRLQWYIFELTSNQGDLEELKEELDECLPITPSKPYSVQSAFTSQTDIDKFDSLSSSIVDAALPTDENDEYWIPTGPFTYPMITPP